MNDLFLPTLLSIDYNVLCLHNNASAAQAVNVHTAVPLVSVYGFSSIVLKTSKTVINRQARFISPDHEISRSINFITLRLCYHGLTPEF